MATPQSQPERPGDRPRLKASDERFCKACGQLVRLEAVTCPHCGALLRGAVSKGMLLLVTFLLGGLGGHKFYLKKPWQGLVYLVFFWTAVPAIVALVEFLIYVFTTEERLRARYPAGTSTKAIVILLCAVAGLVGASIVAAIVLPLVLGSGARAYEAALRAEARNVVVAQQRYFLDHNTYTANLRALGFQPGMSDAVIRILSADATCFELEATHPRVREPVRADCRGLKGGSE